MKKDWLKNALYIAMSLTILVLVVVLAKKFYPPSEFVADYYGMVLIAICGIVAAPLVIFYPPTIQRRKRDKACKEKAKELNASFVGQKFLFDMFKETLVHCDTKSQIADLKDMWIYGGVFYSDVIVTFVPVVIKSIEYTLEKMYVKCEQINRQKGFVCKIEHITFYWAIAHNDVLGTVFIPIDKAEGKEIGQEIIISLD